MWMMVFPAALAWGFLARVSHSPRVTRPGQPDGIQEVRNIRSKESRERVSKEMETD